MKIYRNIKKLHTFKGFLNKDGRMPLEKDFSVIRNASLVVENGLVSWVGKDINLKNFLKDGSQKYKEIDLKQKNIFPSFTESHTHLTFGGDRKKEFEKKIQGATYQQIQKSGGGISKTVKDTKKVSLENLKAVSQKRALAFKTQGVTLLEVKSGYGQSFKDEKKQIEAAFSIKGLKVIPSYLALHSFNLEKNSREDYVERVLEKDLLKMKQAFPRLSRADAFIEKGFFTLKDLSLFVEKMRAQNFEFCVHADQLSLGGGVLASAKLGALSVEHAVYLKDQDFKELSKYKTIFNLLPAADFYLNTKYPEARKIIDHGNRVSLATDYNPGSSPTKNLSFIGVLARRQMKMSLAEVWCAYTLNASKALGVLNKGALVKGFQADFFSTDAEAHDFFYEVGEHPVHKVFMN